MSNNVHIDNNLESLKISDAARMLGVSTKTLRRWEVKNLIKSHRSPTGHRVYTSDDLRSVRQVSQESLTPKKDNLFKLTLLTLGLATTVIGYSSGVSFGSPEVDQTESKPAVLATSTEDATIPSISDFTFAVNVPAKFSEGVTFSKNIKAPNIVTSVNGDTGDVTVEFELTAGGGITVDSTTTVGTFKITNSGITSLTAGTGISVSGSTITNSGITSLTAGTGISVSGSTITNTLTPDYTLSGWTDSGTTLKLTTITDSVGIGIAVPTSTLHVVGSANLAGNVTLGEDSGDTITINAGMLAGSSITPQVDLGADLGSALKRFNNLWVANINSNSSQAFSGQTTFSYAPTDTTLAQGSVIINPTTSSANGQLLGLAIAGYQKALIDEDGDIILGYSDATSAPASDYPLNIYGHSGTKVAYIDTSGNALFAGLTSDRIVSSTTGGLLTTSISSANAALSISDETGSGLSVFNTSPTFTTDIRTPLVIGSTSANGTLTFEGNNTTGNTSTNANLIFKTGDSAGTTAMTILNSGNVGIGTTEPSSLLSLSTNPASTNSVISMLTIERLTTGTGQVGLGARINFDLEHSNGSVYTAGSINTAWQVASGSYMAFNIYKPGTGSFESLRMDNQGNVGIGTTAPSYKLHVNDITAGTPTGLSGGVYRVNSVNYGSLGSNSQIGFVGSSYYSSSANLPTNPLGNAYAVAGLVGIGGGSSAGSYGIGVFGFGQTSGSARTTGTVGGKFIGSISQNLNAAETVYGVQTESSGTGSNTADNVYGLSATATGGTGDITYGGYFTGTGGTTNYGLYSASGTNYFADNVGIGTTSPTGKLNVVGTTEQMRLGYDASNYWSNTVGISGGLTMQGVGAGGALTLSPTAGQNVNIALSGAGNLGIAGTSGVDALRLTSGGSKVLGLSYGTNNIAMTTASTDPTNKLTNGTFDSDLTSWTEVPSYTLNDQFTTDRAAGAVNGTSAEPTGGTRTVVDTNSKLSITGGQASFDSTGQSPRLWYPSTARVAGKLLTETFNMTTTSGSNLLGFDTNQAGDADANSFYLPAAAGLNVYDNAGAIIPVGGAISYGTSYQLSIILRSSGAYYYIKGGTYTNWTLVWISSLNSTSPVFPHIGGYYGTFTADNIRIPTATWLPTPLAYDTFTRADGAISSSETAGPDAQTTPSLAWTGGAISTNKNVITPTLGSELVTNGNFANWTANNPNNWTTTESGTDPEVSEVGTGQSHGGTGTGMVNMYASAGVVKMTQDIISVGSWYNVSLDLDTVISGDVGVSLGPWTAVFSSVGSKFTTGRATSPTFMISRYTNPINMTIDNASVKPLTLSSLFSTVSTSDSDVIVDANVTSPEVGVQAGVALNLNSASTPTEGVVAYLTRTNATTGANVTLDKFTTATTWTNVMAATTVTYSEGATLRVIKDGTKYRVYYNNALVGSEQTISDATLIDNTIHGLFSTYSTNTFDNFTLWPRGTGGEFSDGPFEELTATRNTTTTYNNSTASVQLVTSSTGDATYLQSANVGDTQTYNLIAYAYTTGAAVTSADLSLYYDTGTLTTTYTAMGGTGWYKLTGSFTGVASSKSYGVKVKAGKTVYVDDVHVQVGVGTAQTMYVMNSNTGVTGLNVQGIVNGTLNGIATLTKAGTVSDTDFTDTAVNGLMGIDTTNHRLYFREGGTWSYIARTGGFQIPAEESLSLSIGDLLVPYVESRMSDGAVHGLYKKMSDVVLDGLMVSGDTTLGDAIISGSLLANDINSTLTLKLQSLDLAGIEFVGGKIKFTKEGLIFGNDLIRGKTIITTGQNEIRVDKVWTDSPISITATADYDTNIWIDEISTSGFKIHVSNPPTATESGIYWQALW